MKKSTSTFLILSLLNLLGCYSMKEISRNELIQKYEEGDIRVITTNNKTYEFNKTSYVILPDSISGTGVIRTGYKDRLKSEFKGSIAFEDVNSIEMDHFDFVVSSIIFISIVGIMIYLSSANNPLSIDL
jgi:hypothetical protein